MGDAWIVDKEDRAARRLLSTGSGHARHADRSDERRANQRSSNRERIARRGIRAINRWLEFGFDVFVGYVLVFINYALRSNLRAALALSLLLIPALCLGSSYVAFSAFSWWFNFVPVVVSVMIHEFYEHAREYQRLAQAYESSQQHFALGHEPIYPVLSEDVGLDDVNSRVRRAVATLPPLADKLVEIEAVLRRPVAFVIDPGLAGQAGGKAACPEGVISLPPDSAENLSVIGEEIMHLHRCTRGYPTIVPGVRSVLLGYKSSLQALSGFFDEHACFPFLEGLGLDPRGQITPRMGPTAAALEAQIDEIQREGFTESWRVNLAAVYVQAALMAPPSPDRDRLLTLFDRPALHHYRELGRTLCAAIDLAVAQQPGEVERTMTSCVRDVLNLTNDAATVRRWF